MAGNRVPLCFAYIRKLGEWREFRSANSVKGMRFVAVVWIRRPSSEEEESVEAALVEGGRSCTMYELLEGKFAHEFAHDSITYYPF